MNTDNYIQDFIDKLEKNNLKKYIDMIYQNLESGDSLIDVYILIEHIEDEIKKKEIIISNRNRNINYEAINKAN